MVGLPPLAGNLAERDNVAAAEVAFLLGTVKAPEPDIVFLAFVFLQSLWGLACRPRRTNAYSRRPRYKIATSRAVAADRQRDARSFPHARAVEDIDRSDCAW